MEKSDPLYMNIGTGNSSARCKSLCNKRGRPLKVTVKTFNTPPKSIIISQLLQEKLVKPVDTDHEPKLKYQSEIASEDHDTFHNDMRTVYNNEYGTIAAQSREYRCDFPECKYSCKFGSNVIKHKRTHGTEKSYACDECPFQTKFVNSLKVHKRLHTGEKPYICEYCTYRCNSISNLKKHWRHIHSEIL